MLIVKLSSQRYVKDTIWIHLIHKYFDDLLLQPLSGGKPDETSAVEDSPFCSSISEPGKLDMMSHHLQRLAVFVFLKFSLNLVSSKENSDKQCTREDRRLCLTSDTSLDSEQCAKCQGLSELQKWLQVHVPADIFMYNKLHFDRCVRFTRSFLQLYIHEVCLNFVCEVTLVCVIVPIYASFSFYFIIPTFSFIFPLKITISCISTIQRFGLLFVVSCFSIPVIRNKTYFRILLAYCRIWKVIVQSCFLFVQEAHCGVDNELFNYCCLVACSFTNYFLFSFLSLVLV